MCTREMTLGEEIINLTKRGIDVPTVERMYRKYIDLDEKGKSEGCYAIDLGPLFPTFDIGDTNCSNASNSVGVRPEFWLVR